MLEVVELTKTCNACPAQWEGKTADGRFVYVRFRWGWLSIGLGDTLEQAVGAAVGCPEGEEVFEWNSGDAYLGFMEFDQLRDLTRGVIDWP